jgi:transcriptional regulator with GAF, ATPase, and Fis domain
MGAETGGDIVVWAIEQSVLAGDSGGELIGIPSFSSAQSSMMVPIKQSERTVGAFYIQSEHSDAFDNYDRLVFEFLASQINIAHEKSCQLNLERKKTEYLSLVSDMGRKITGVLTVPELSCMVADLIHQHFAYCVVAIFLCDPV